MTLARGDDMLADLDVLRVTRDITVSITPGYEGVLSPRTIERSVSESLAELAGQAKIPDFLALLTWREVSRRLREAASPQAPPPGRPPQVLIVCGTQPALGVVAAAMFDALAHNRIRIRLGGCSDEPLPAALAGALEAAGLDVFRRRPERVDRAAVEAADVVVTVTSDEACPLAPGKRYVDWRLVAPHPDDPDGAAAVVEEVRLRVGALLESLRPFKPLRRVIPL